MRVGRGRRRHLILVRTFALGWRTLIAASNTLEGSGRCRIQTASGWHERQPWGVMPRMLGACMTCTATYSNGVWTGMATMRVGVWQTRKDLHRACSACFGAAVGSTTPGNVDRRTATSAPRTLVETALASGLCLRQVSELEMGERRLETEEHRSF